MMVILMLVVLFCIIIAVGNCLVQLWKVPMKDLATGLTAIVGLLLYVGWPIGVYNLVLYAISKGVILGVLGFEIYPEYTVGGCLALIGFIAFLFTSGAQQVVHDVTLTRPDKIYWDYRRNHRVNI